MSEARSLLTGRIVDTYTNIVTVKLFARAKDEDAYVREAVDQHTGRFHESLRLNTLFASDADRAQRLADRRHRRLRDRAVAAMAISSVGAVAMALPMTTQIVNVSGWVAWQVTSIFENIGVVQEGMMTIARPHTLVDSAGRRAARRHARRSPLRGHVASAMAARAG